MNQLRKGEILNNRYIISNFIAKGGMGYTYKAEDKTTGKNVAIKILVFSELKDWKILELFEREIKTLSNIDHPNIPDYIDSFKIEDEKEILYVLVQEFIDGKNIQDLIKNGKHFSEEEIISILLNILLILDYIHNIQPPIIHRDINPKNIIIGESGKIYLVDFGAVGDIAQSTIFGSNTFVGTIGYMPQEQLYGKTQPASDFYALGATILFILTGKEPSDFELKNMKIDYENRINISDRIKKLIGKMLEPDYNKRINNAKTAIEFLEGKKDFDRNVKIKNITKTNRLLISNDEAGNKIIKVKQNKLLTIFLVLFVIVWDIISVVFFGVDFGEGETFDSIIMIPFVLGGIFINLFLIVSIFGKYRILLTDKHINYELKVFGISFIDKTIEYKDYQGSKITIHRGSKGSIYHLLNLYSKNQTIKVGRFLSLDNGDLEIIKEIIEDHIEKSEIF